MSFLVSDAIQDMNQELNLIGQRMTDSDYILFLNRANKYFYTNYKMPTSQARTSLIAYAGVEEYGLPSDYIGIMEPERPYSEWSPNFNHTTEKEFVHWPYGRTTAIKWQRETPFLIFHETSLSKEMLNDCESLTGNGTWTISGDGSNLAVDEQVYTEGSASLKFYITPSTGSTALECTNMNPVDLSDILNNGSLFFDLFTPLTNTVDISSITFSVGPSSVDFLSNLATVRFRGDTISVDWGQVGFDGAGFGTGVDMTACTYLRIDIAHGTTGVAGTYRIDNIFGSKGMFYEIPYYSKYNIKGSDGSYKEKITATDDTVLCPVDFDEAFTYKTLEIASAMRLRDAAMANYAGRELLPKENYLKSKYPRQESRTQMTWYKGANRF